MKICIITGSAGLIGAEAVRFFSSKGFDVVGIDNDMRKQFFGDEASTEWSRRDLESKIPNYTHHEIDIRDREGIESLFAEYGSDIELIVHTAAQPSHDWAAKDPHTDFTVNANGTLILLEATRKFSPAGLFHFHFHQQSLRRQPQQPAPGRAGDAVGDRQRPTRTTSTGSTRICRSIRPSTRCSASPSSRPMPWSRNMAATSE